MFRQLVARRSFTLLSAVTAALTLAAQLVAAPLPAEAAPAVAPTVECPDERPDRTAALESARLCGGRVRIGEMTSPTSEFYVTADGQIEATVAASPVRVRTSDGWAPVDLTLVRKADGTVAAKAHPGGLSLSGAVSGSGEHELAAVGSGDERVSMGWTGPLPQPTLDGTKATYAEVLAGVDLVVEATRTGFEQLLVVKNRAALNQVRGLALPVTSKAAVSYGRDASGNLALKDKAGKAFARVPAPEMWDAAATPVEALRERVPVGTGVVQRAAKGTAKPGVEMRLAPSSSWLDDPARVFPITIDPTVNPVSTTFDTYVKQNDIVDRGGANDLQVGLVSGDITRALLRWDSSSFVGAHITSATTYFWNFWSQTCTAKSWDLWSVSAATEGMLWDTQPSWLTKEATSSATKGFDSSCNDGWVSISSTSFFQRAADNNQTRGYMGLRATSETDGNSFKQFRSRNAADASQVPYSVVTYNGAPTIDTRSTIPSTACVTGTGRPSINTGTPKLSAVASDPEGSTVTTNFEWQTTAGAAVGSASTSAQASGTTHTVTVGPALINGSSYRWRVRANDGTSAGAWSGWCEFTVDTGVLPAAPADYAYDGAGQLRGVSRAGGESARYAYDDAGNLKSVARSAAGALTISSLTPSQAPPGASITISGTGFATTAAANTVAFNGTAATVTSASATRLVVTVPAGAGSGTVTVTTTAGTATSDQTFTVGAALPAPTISGFTPTTAAAGTTVTITGTGFATTPAANTVSFGRTRARVTAATATTLTVTVPEAAGSGRVTVATAGGNATSSSDFVAVPKSYAAADIGTTTVLALDGTPSTVTIATAGKSALVRFSGTKGQRLSLGLNGTALGNVAALGFDPYGRAFARDQYDGAFFTADWYGSGLALPVLPTSGTYQFVLDPVSASATGSITVTLSSRVTGALSLTGSGTAVNLSRAGQHAELTVTATAGQYLSFGLTGETFSAIAVIAELREPNGTPVLWSADGATKMFVYLDGSDLDVRASLAGTYTLLLTALEGSTGAVTVTASTPVDAGTLTVGTPKSVTTSRPGQDARLSFTGAAGQLLALDFSAYAPTYAPYVSVYRPDGTLLTRGVPETTQLDLPALPVGGTYTVSISPFSSSGSFTVTLVDRQGGGTISATGPAVEVYFAGAGDSVDLSFTGTAGQYLSAAFTGWTFTSGTVDARVLDPSGTEVAAYKIASPDLPENIDSPWRQSFSFPTSTAGTYHLVLTPNDPGTGGVSVTLAQEIAGGALSVATAKTVTSSRAGQTTRLTFAGTANQLFSLVTDTDSYNSLVVLQVYKPDGTLLRQDAWDFDLDPLPVTGTYQVVVVPYAGTGSLDLTLFERVDAGPTTVGGSAKTLTVPSPGGFAETSVTATAGERLSFGFTNPTFSNSAYSPDFQLFIIYPHLRGRSWGGTLSAAESVDFTAPAAGTYRILVGAWDLGPGAVTLTVSDQIDGGALTLNSAKTVTASRVGQSTRLTYAGTAGQTLAVTFDTVTMPQYPYVEVRNPDDTILVSSQSAATINLPALPTTGTYELLVSPGPFTGSAVMTLAPRTGSAPPMINPYADTDRPAIPDAGGERLAATATAKGAPPSQQLKKLGYVPKGSAAASGPAGGAPAAAPLGDRWTPTADNLAGKGWTTGRPGAEQPAASALRAPAGTTALTGRVVTLDGKPLPKVTVIIEGVTTTTDAQGQFLLTGVKPGHRVLRVDGSTAGSAGRSFGLYDIGVDATAGQTVVLPYPIWLAALDTQHVVSFPSPTTKEVSITTPAIPGLEVRLPAGAVVRDVNGKVVTQLGITAIPVDRPPFPLPRSQVPSYFTVQPGSSYIFPTGARVIYPNFTHAAPGAKMDFWHYDPAGKGWFVYGHGTVTKDGKRVEPDPGTEVYQFTGAMLITPGIDPPPATAPVPGGGARGADPVDLGSGLLVDEHTDLTVDDVLPIAVRRTYQQSDTGRRSFGIGVNSDYDINLYSENRFVECWLLLPDGGRIRYHRITPGSTGPNDFLNAALAADPTPTRFAGSILAWNGDGWDVRLRDGTTYVFGDESPLQAIRDRFGNTVTITRAAAAADSDGMVRAKGPITQVTSPNGKWIKFSYDTQNRITRAEDTLGRAVTYTYDTGGHLATVTDPNLGVTTYTYESGRLKTIKDARNTVYLTNTYDTNGRVSSQLTPAGTYGISYTTDAAGKVTEARLTDPRGQVRRVTFNAAGFTTSDTAAYGTTLAQTLQITRDATTNLPTAYVDALNRRTELVYDAYGNITSLTELAGTANARTTTVAYGGPFDQVSQITDPLGHQTNLTYQTNGATRTIADALSRVTTLDTNEAGQVTKVTDNESKTLTYGYVLGDLVTRTDQLSRVSRATADDAGRIVRTVDPQGNVTTAGYDAASHVRTVTDPLGRVTAYEYDANGNLTKVTDPRNNATIYGYDTSDRLTSVKDALNRTVATTYDGNDNVATVTSARGKVTAYEYDALDRPTLVRYGASGTTQESQTSYAYDAGNRVTSIVDSAGGTTTLTPDLFDRITRAVTPQGQVDYTYDAADRRLTMTVAGQTQVTYGYDNADALTTVTRGTEAVSIGYDTLGRRASVTLPAGVAQTYAYDDASQLTGITYKRGSTTLGTITYAYDQVGRPIHVDGTYARVDLPAAYGPASYDAANQLTTVGTTTNTYDADGNLTGDGTATYTWNARGELTGYAKTGLSVTYGYDGMGRRVSRASGGTTTGYLYDGLNTVQEKTGSTVSANLLTGGLDEVFTRTTSAGTRSLLTDALGSTVALADTTSVGAEYSYQPFGATTLTGDDLGNATRFTGREDDGTGLYYARARYYSTATSRFISKDPLGLGSGDTNAYTYVFNQPTGLVDPMGTKPEGSGDCVSNSFAAGTPVLLADGTTKPIEQVRVGDSVLASDPTTGERAAKRVTATIVGDGDKRLIDISVSDAHGATSTVTATDGHPFWVDSDGRPDTPDGQWINAAELRQGQWLKTSDGRLVKVAGIHAYAQHTHVYNLTVDDLHTYYVLAGYTAVLVHNCTPDPELGFETWEGKDGMRKALGSAGKDADGNQMSWEHVVEQSQIDSYRSGFDPRIINHPDNIVKMRYDLNTAKGLYYGKAWSFTGGKMLRDWIKGSTWQQQHDFGMFVIRRLEAGLPLPK